jgi:NAD(P)-dependent dehydrogenase (short-subunit alcohol dehydrogenase family)
MAKALGVAVVTGGNRGIGREICRQLAKQGFQVVLTARDAAKGKAAAKALKQELGPKAGPVEFFKLDVTDAKRIRALARHLESEFGGCDVLVNNAGIYLEGGYDAAGSPIDSIQTEPMSKVRETMETNLYGPLQLIQAILPMMKTRKRGRIVNVSSGSGQLTGMGVGEAGYRIAKTGLNAVTAIFAAELTKDPKAKDILVNCMCPGWVKSDMGGPYATRSLAQGADTAVWLATLPKGGPTGGFYRDRKILAW